MNTSKKRVTKSTQGKIKLTKEETPSSLPVQSGVRAGTSTSFRSSPVSFTPVSFSPVSFSPVSFASSFAS